MKGAVPIEFLAAWAGMLGVLLLALALWRRSVRRRRSTSEALFDKHVPQVRDGRMVTALVVEILPFGQAEVVRGPCTSEPWFGEAVRQSLEVLRKFDLTAVGAFRETLLATNENEIEAVESIRRTALAALEIRDHLSQLFSANQIAASVRFGLHADTIPLHGLGSTLALNRLWQGGLEACEHGAPNSIRMTEQAAIWLDHEFEIEALNGRPVLVKRSAA